MMKILAIGNSFSEDASAYIHQMAESAGYDVQIVNLYIGGCPLERHCRLKEQLYNVQVLIKFLKKIHHLNVP